MRPVWARRAARCAHAGGADEGRKPVARIASDVLEGGAALPLLSQNVCKALPAPVHLLLAAARART